MAASFYFALVFRFLAVPNGDFLHYVGPLNHVVLPIMLVFALVNLLFGLSDHDWRYAGGQVVSSILSAAALSTAVTLVGDVAWSRISERPLPLSVIILGGLLSAFGFVVTRYRSRVISGFTWRWSAIKGHFPSGGTRTLIYGAGEAGQLLARQLQTTIGKQMYSIVGFIDDDPAKRGLRIYSARVIGSRRSLCAVVEREKVDLIILAIPTADKTDLREIITACQDTPARVRVAPNALASVAQHGGGPLLREVGVEDLLGRTPISVDRSACARVLSGKTVLVTGACGSIGSELCRQIAAFGPARLFIVDNNETGLYDLNVELGTKFPGVFVTPTIGDVAHRRRVDEVFAQAHPEVVYHVAAYKHVPLMELYPEEAVRVNIGGTRNVVMASRRHNAERFVLVSTDKAVNASSVMGATKRVAEMLVVSPRYARPGAGSGDAGERTICAAVRFGNVLGSRGSVVPTFARQIELGGPVTVTHPEMTRYFMEISEAASLIIQATSLTQGEDIFVLDMGEPIPIDDLARKMIRMRGLRPGRDIAITYTGIRPGEKLHEELFYAADEQSTTLHPSISRTRGQYAELADILPLVDEVLELATIEARSKLRWKLFALASADSAPAPAGSVGALSPFSQRA